ncbi:MAG: hypothetical protein NTV80_13835 [Verrucomicrobia bacterium]|nr:hypothetical protein [Verrucomicrobiota bacterium]
MSRLVSPLSAGWQRGVAEAVISLRFSDEDQQRATLLAEKNREGSLTPEEKQEMEQFMLFGRFIDLMQSRARLSLKQSQAA